MTTPTPPERPPGHDYGYEAQQAAEAHLAMCRQALDCEEGQCELHPEEGEERCPWPDNMGGPYCACDTCDVRETLHVAWPIIWAGMKSGDFDAVAPT